MRIALYHNLGPGGGKRHLYEQARELQARGHVLDLFVPATANETFLPLAPLCREVKVYGGSASGNETMAAAPTAPRESDGGRVAVLRRAARTVFGNAGHDALAERVYERRLASRIADLAVQNAQIARDIDDGAYDVAYVHQCALTIAPGVLRLVRNVPTVFVCHDTPRWAYEWAVEESPDYDSLPEKSGRRRRLGSLVSRVQGRLASDSDRRFVANCRAATMVLSNSCYSRECTVRATGTNPRICYPGVDTEFFAPGDAPATERRRDVLSVGALLPTKQHEFILRAVAAIPASRRPGLGILGYESPAAGGKSGRGIEGKRLSEIAGGLGVTLTLNRDVTDTTIRDAYRRAAVVAFPPYLEPFGLVALEAMACETPVVGVREGGVRETVRDGETGLLTDRDIPAFAAALDRILSDPELGRRMGSAGRERARSEWSWSRSVDVAESWLHRAVKERR